MSKSHPPAFEELKSHLRDMFHLDRGDLDFGIYRVMNIKRDEVEEFLENRLLPQVREILGEYSSSNRDAIEKDIKHAFSMLNPLKILHIKNEFLTSSQFFCKRLPRKLSKKTLNKHT